MSAPVHAAYYAHTTGRWRGDLSVRVADVPALLRARVPVLARLQVLLLAVVERLLGPADLTTEVRPRPDGRHVDHLALLSRFGIVLYRGERTFHLAPDGRTLSVTGREASFPFLGWRRELPEGTGEILDARHARYAMPMAGIRWAIDFEMTENTGVSHLACEGATARERLTRVD